MREKADGALGCDTDVVEAHKGESVYGLRRVLALAGAETQMTSPWTVSALPDRGYGWSWNIDNPFVLN